MDCAGIITVLQNYFMVPAVFLLHIALSFVKHGNVQIYLGIFGILKK